MPCLHEQSTISPGLRVVAIGGDQVLLDELAPYVDIELGGFAISRDCMPGYLVQQRNPTHMRTPRTLF